MPPTRTKEDKKHRTPRHTKNGLEPLEYKVTFDGRVYVDPDELISTDVAKEHISPIKNLGIRRQERH